VYYIGTDTLKKGYPLCYNFDATTKVMKNKVKIFWSTISFKNLTQKVNDWLEENPDIEIINISLQCVASSFWNDVENSSVLAIAYKIEAPKPIDCLS